MASARQTGGWCTDPVGRHEARWLSGGTLTTLVRDGGAASMGSPSEVPGEEAVPVIWDERIADGADPLRSDQRMHPDSGKFERVVAVRLGGGSNRGAGWSRAPSR